jgi:mannose-6-phosphate isomerase-like protein (cupin superfamily)
MTEHLDISAMGAQVEVRESIPDLLEFDITGRPFGLLTQPHVHTRQAERYEILEGAMRLVTPTADIHLTQGESYELPAGVTHSQIPATEHLKVRIQVRPRANSHDLFRRFAELSAAGEFTRWGLPKPRATADLVLDFADDNRAAQPPVAVQRALARAIARR